MAPEFVTIIGQQLVQSQAGLNRFKVMTGMTQASYSEEERSLSLKWKAQSKNKSNYMKIRLTPDDLYTVEFGRIWGSKFKEISKHEGIYNDMLKELFESETGLYLSL